MARIRTIKPEIWTDPDFIDLSLSARLLLIASLNFASDYGVLADKPRQIKMQCLPADDGDAGGLIEELVNANFMYRATAPNGENVLVIRTFSKNQKVNRASPGRWGNPEGWPKSPTPLSESSVSPTPRKGRDSSEGMFGNGSGPGKPQRDIPNCGQPWKPDLTHPRQEQEIE
jgi:hypothetical protein